MTKMSPRFAATLAQKRTQPPGRSFSSRGCVAGPFLPTKADVCGLVKLLARPCLPPSIPFAIQLWRGSRWLSATDAQSHSTRNRGEGRVNVQPQSRLKNGCVSTLEPPKAKQSQDYSVSSCCRGWPSLARNLLLYKAECASFILQRTCREQIFLGRRKLFCGWRVSILRKRGSRGFRRF